MSVNLEKGQRVDLTKGRPSLHKLLIGLGWDTNHYDGESDFDLDASVFITGANGKVNLQNLPNNSEKISVAVTIYDANNRLQNFGMVENAYIRVLDEETGEQLLRYDLSEDFSTETAIVVGEIYRRNNEWKFKAVGSGYNGGLEALCRTYGIDVE